MSIYSCCPAYGLRIPSDPGGLDDPLTMFKTARKLSHVRCALDSGVLQPAPAPAPAYYYLRISLLRSRISQSDRPISARSRLAKICFRSRPCVCVNGGERDMLPKTFRILPITGLLARTSNPRRAFGRGWLEDERECISTEMRRESFMTGLSMR